MTKTEVQNLETDNKIVYYVDDEYRSGFADPNAWRVHWGLFAGYDRGNCIIEPLVSMETRWVKTMNTPWMPFNDFESETEWHKLPKHWSYDTELFWIENRYPDDAKEWCCDVDNLAEIQKAFDKGWLVTNFNIDHRVIESDIDHDYYRIVKKAHDLMYIDHTRYSVYLKPKQIYVEYDKAKKYADARYADEKRRADKANHRNAMESLEKHLTYVDKNLVDKYREKILSMGKIEDFILRHVDGEILWSYRNIKPFVWKKVEI